MGHTDIMTILWVCFMFVSCKEQLAPHCDIELSITSELTTLQSKLSQLEYRLAQVETENIHLKNTHGWSVSIHWGKQNCHGNGTSQVYNGFAGGSHHRNHGGGVNTLCMAAWPTWNKYNDTRQKQSGRVYGVEVNARNTAPLLGKDYLNQDVPCAVCKVPMSTVIMIPGRVNWYPGWTQQYTGYLMSGHYDSRSNTDYICLDEHPEAVPNGRGYANEHVLFFTEAVCGSLPCQFYNDGREIACVVCSQ